MKYYVTRRKFGIIKDVPKEEEKEEEKPVVMEMKKTKTTKKQRKVKYNDSNNR